MTKLKLSDIRWIQDDLAAGLEAAGVTVEMLAAMDANELLQKYPFVGTINAWLLTSEAAFLLDQVNEGLWDPNAQAELAETLDELAILEEQERALQIRPQMVWPPPEGTEPPPPTQSVRIARIQRLQEVEEESQRMRVWLAEQLENERIAEEKQRAWQAAQDSQRRET